jgi:hypothetical protein
MESFTHTRLWKNTLAERSNDNHSESRSRLRTAFLTFRHRAGQLAEEIPLILPQLTKHDLTHIDALWALSDSIIGDELWKNDNGFINPLEAFVLGCAFLVHDLAHSEASLQEPLEVVRCTPAYLDALAKVVRDKGIATEAEHKEALAIYLRETHAVSAPALVKQHWTSREGDQHFLLMDEELRSFLGNSIGRLAASHHWPVERLPDEFPFPIGSPPFLHFGDCDLLKLSSIIRLADAAHLDARRAPAFVATLRKLEGVSKNHWDFQKHLHKPGFAADRIRFTSDYAFPLDLHQAWWLCFDTLKMVDSELFRVDSMLSDLNRPRFQIRSVAGVDDPKRLSRLIPTSGWIPVDTQIKVNNVVGLVTRLGGTELYGRNPTVSLREILQNASDAIKARRLLDDDETAHSISVALTKSSTGWRLQIDDTGIGMSEAVLTGPLLDFGTSFWKSESARKELPGLSLKNFEPTGRYGIGFFSIFMLGSTVKVTSRRYDQGQSATRVLEFRDGLYSRPVLRQAIASDRLTAGTRIEVDLAKSPYELGGLLAGDGNSLPELSLKEMCAWLCPTFEVDIKTKGDSEDRWQLAVKANDWLTIDPAELLSRVIKSRGRRDKQELARIIDRSAKQVREINSNGKTIARACVLAVGNGSIDNATDFATITVGGSRSEQLSRLGGVFLGASTRAARDLAIPFATEEELAIWASNQARLLSSTALNVEIKSITASVTRAYGGDAHDLPVAWSNSGWLNADEIAAYARKYDEIVVISDSSKSLLSQNRTIRFKDGVLACSMARYSSFNVHSARGWSSPRSWSWNGSTFAYWTSEGAVVEAVARG